MRPDLPTGTVTFLFTDVEGSTKLLHELGAEGYAEALAEHRRLIREACVSEGGVEVDTQGDAFFFAFPTAPGALAATEAFTEALAGGPIRVRIGVHTGTPLLAEEGYVGEDVHRAARIGAAGHGGQVLVAATTASLVDVGLRDLGEHRFKDLAAPERVYQLGDREFPPLKSLYRSNLPIPANPLVGRKKELLDVMRLLREGARVVTVTGPGGVGKTRFAVAVAGEASDGFPDGTWFVPLAPLRDPALVLPTVAGVVGAEDDLARHIGDDECLVLLDNLEHLIEAAPGLAALVSACPRLRVLVTSREGLRVAFEREYPLSPLPESPCVELFRQRSAAVAPEDEIDYRLAAAICERLDRLPLAIELAAARCKALSPAQILERLSQRLDLLKGGRDADPRQQTLRATIEWSYDLLSDEEQGLVARLSVFAGGCTLEAAEDVCDADLDALQSLVEKSLVRFSNERYWWLETIREFAAEKLTGPQRTQLADRHLAYFASELEKLGWSARARDQTAWTYLHVEQANILAALEHAIATDAAEAAQKIVVGAWFYWLVGGLAAEADSWAARVAALPSERTVLYALSLALAGEFARGRGELRRAQTLKSSGLEVLEQLDRSDPVVARWVSAIETDLGDVYAQLGDLETAQKHAQRALDIRRGLGDVQGIAHALGGVGQVLIQRGAYADAAEAFEEASALLDEGGDRVEAAVSLSGLGEARRKLGDLSGSREALEDALQRVLEAPDRLDSAYIHAELGLLAAAEGNPEIAVELLSRASAELERLGLVAVVEKQTEASQVLETCHADLGEASYRAAVERGRAAADLNEA